MMNNWITLLAIVFGAAGFWQVFGYILNYRLNHRLKKAESGLAQAHAETTLIQNWIDWSAKLEARVKELEALSIENFQLRSRIEELENQVRSLKTENARLRAELHALMNKQ